MRRSYGFYQKKLGLDKYLVDLYYSIFMDVLNGKIDDKKLSLLNKKEALQMCLYENLFSVFKAILYPSVYIENGDNYYRYLIDPISLGIVEFIHNAPSSLGEALSRARYLDDKRTDEEILRESIVIIPSEKESLLRTIYYLDKKRIDKVKIQDILAREISGWCHPIHNLDDVVYYSEISNVFPSIELYKMNILTTYNDTWGGKGENFVSEDDAKCEIRIDYDSLDEENRLYADTLVQRGIGKVIMESETKKGISIFTPCKRSETVGKVNARTMEILKGFHKQDVLFGVYTNDEIVSIINYHLRYSQERVSDQVLEIAQNGLDSLKILHIFSILGVTDFYYDSAEDKFWKEKSYFERHLDYLSEKGIEVNKLEKKYPDEQ